MKTATTSFLPVLATMLLTVCIAPFARADRAENAFVIVEGDGVVRIDGRNFAVLGDGSGEETEVTIKPQPGWILLTPSKVTVKAGSPVPFRVKSKSMEEMVNGKMTVIRIELTAYDCCHDASGTEIPWNAKAEGPVPEDKEDTEGAYIHWNIDNDNKSTGGTATHPGGDYLETSAAVTNEDDLKKLDCSLVSDDFPQVPVGTVTLEVKSSNAKIWKARTKGASNLVATQSNPAVWKLENDFQRKAFYSVCKSLFVEGVDRGSCVIELRFSVKEKSIADSVKYTFISANCGRQASMKQTFLSVSNDPGKMFSKEIELLTMAALHPNLVGCEWSILEEQSMASLHYNCLAWAIGRSDLQVQPSLDGNSTSGEIAVSFGGNIVKVLSIDATYGPSHDVVDGKASQREIDAFFAANNFAPVSNIEEADVIYLEGFHAAVRKKRCGCGAGKWEMFESKLGPLPRIEHVWNQIAGGGYGNICRFYKKNN